MDLDDKLDADLDRDHHLILRVVLSVAVAGSELGRSRGGDGPQKVLVWGESAGFRVEASR